MPEIVSETEDPPEIPSFSGSAARRPEVAKTAVTMRMTAAAGRDAARVAFLSS